MSVTSTAPTSRRGYLSRAELAEFANITITDTAEADDQISQAEEIIDGYVGYQDTFLTSPITGRAQSAGSTTITLQSKEVNVHQIDYFKGCEIEILGGTGVGQRRIITASTLAGVLTIDVAWATTPDSTSFYRIYQLGKFPRKQDVVFFNEVSPAAYYKQIPEGVKRAVAAQVEYMIEQGDDYFKTDQGNIKRERLGDFEQEFFDPGTGGITTTKMIAPKAKKFLSGLRNITGKIIV